MVKIVKRPWGNFKQFVLNNKCTVKILEVNPGEELSLQKHRKRKEMWYFLTNGVVLFGNKKKNFRQTQIINIGNNVAHRLIAENKKVQVLEVSFGEFNENDEIKLEDKYKRK